MRGLREFLLAIFITVASAAVVAQNYLNAGDRQLNTDNTTVGIPQNTGLSIDSTIVNIIGENIPENGVCSAYTAHLFSLSNPENDLLADINWQFLIESLNNEYVTVASASGTTEFLIDSVSNAEEYNITDDGYLSGIIVCDLKINGVQKKLSYHFSLGLIPVILNVTDLELTMISDYFYNCSFVVEYYGSDHLIVNLEQEYMSTVVSDYVYEPVLAHATVYHISRHLYTWIDIIADNKYGTTTKTIEIPPFDNIDDIQAVDQISQDPFCDSIYNVYDISGHLIMSNAGRSDLDRLQTSKIYILKTVSDGNEIKTIKYIRR